MKIEEIDLLFESASKVLHFDKSHDAIRQKLQASISAQHRMDNASNDSSSSYYNTPYVRDVFGTETDGQVVHAKDGMMTLSNYKQDKKGGYALSNHKKVKHAYVVDPDQANENKESMTLLMDGKELQVSEANKPLETSVMGEILELREAAGAKNSKAKITVITAGKGSMGFYTEASLKKAVKDKIFNGAQMFLNHQTVEERRARPEGDITKLVGKLGTTKYEEGAGGKPGRIVSEDADVYPDYAPFIAARKNDIGVSVRVGAENSGKMQEGVPLVENMVYALSTDFVTKAGRGGKIEELYESYRANPAINSGNPPHEGQMTDEEKKLFEALQESLNDLKKSNAVLVAKVDRLEESNSHMSANQLISEALTASGLKQRGQDRVKKIVLASVPMKDGVIDVAKLQESVAAAVKEEQEYLQEAGGNPRTNPVRYMGASSIKLVDEANKPRKEADVLKEADALLEESMNGIMGIEKEVTA